MWRQRSSLAELNTDILLVSFEPLERIAWYLEEADFSWPALSDEDRTLYRAYGLERTTFVRAWLSPRTVWHYLRAALRGQRIRRPAADSLQLGGDVLIDPAGIVRFIHRSSEPADRPTVERLKTIARSVRRSGAAIPVEDDQR